MYTRRGRNPRRNKSQITGRAPLTPSKPTATLKAQLTMNRADGLAPGAITTPVGMPAAARPPLECRGRCVNRLEVGGRRSTLSRAATGVDSRYDPRVSYVSLNGYIQRRPAAVGNNARAGPTERAIDGATVQRRQLGSAVTPSSAEGGENGAEPGKNGLCSR